METAPSDSNSTWRTAPAVSLLGSELCFDRSGRRLAAIEGDAVVLVDIERGERMPISIPNAQALACFDDQLWIATRDLRWLRVEQSGRVLGEELLPSPGFFIPAPCGVAAAVWMSTPPLALLDDFGQVVRAEFAPVDLALPLTGRRHLVASGAKLRLPSGVDVCLEPGTRVIGGAVTLDARHGLLLTANPGERCLVTISLGAAQVTHRRKVSSLLVRIASRCMSSIVQLEPRVLLAIDSTGRELGGVEFEREVQDLALDADANRCAIRDSQGRVSVHEVEQLFSRRGSRSLPPAIAPDLSTGCPSLPAPSSEGTQKRGKIDSHSEHASEPHRSLHLDVLAALSPRDLSKRSTEEAVASQLQVELRTVTLRTLRAIARAWDSRKLGYGNEGDHPYELEVAAIVGLSGNHAADHVRVAEDHLSRHESAVAQNGEHRSDATPIGGFAKEFGLSGCAVDILLVLAAPSLQGESARLFSILANDPGRACVDEFLVSQILSANYTPQEVASELGPRAPLMRLGIVVGSSSRIRPFSALTVEPVVLDRIRSIAPDLGDATEIRRPDRVLEELDIPDVVVQAAIESLARRNTHLTRIAVRGGIGSGRKTLLAALCGHANRDLAVIDARAFARSPDGFASELGRALTKAHLAGAVPCVSELDEVAFGEMSARDIAAEVLRRHPGPIAVTCTTSSSPPFPPGHTTIDLPALGEAERRVVWTDALARARVQVADSAVDTLVTRYRIAPGVIRRAVHAARERGTTDVAGSCESYIRQTRDTRLAALAHRVERLASWADIVLASDILDSLRELVARVRYGRVVFDEWGMSRVLASSRGLTALFQGPPGTGKTLVAGVIARELGLDLYQVDLSKVMSKWIGETERNLSTIFDAAEGGQVVLLFDEADSLFAKRTEVRSSNDRYANLEVNYLLQRLDTFQGIAILTTNSGTSIDQAFKRRMSFRLSFPFPDEETRSRLWRAHLPPELPISGTLFLDRLAHKYQLAGGYIRNVCVRAAFLAAQEETALEQRHLERAVALEYAELGALSTSGTIS